MRLLRAETATARVDAGAFLALVAGGDDGILVVLDADEEAAEEGSERKGDDGDGDDGEAEPEGEGMPLPLPELMAERDGVGAGCVNQRLGGEGHGGGVEDCGTETDEWNDEQDFEGIDEVIGELRGGDVEAKDKGGGEAEDGGAAEDGIDSDEEADGDAPGKLAWGGSHAEEREDGEGYLAIDPCVMERWPWRQEIGRVGVGRVHG